MGFKLLIATQDEFFCHIHPFTHAHTDGRSSTALPVHSTHSGIHSFTDKQLGAQYAAERHFDMGVGVQSLILLEHSIMTFSLVCLKQ